MPSAWRLAPTLSVTHRWPSGERRSRGKLRHRRASQGCGGSSRPSQHSRRLSSDAVEPTHEALHGGVVLRQKCCENPAGCLGVLPSSSKISKHQAGASQLRQHLGGHLKLPGWTSLQRLLIQRPGTPGVARDVPKVRSLLQGRKAQVNASINNPAPAELLDAADRAPSWEAGSWTRNSSAQCRLTPRWPRLHGAETWQL